MFMVCEIDQSGKVEDTQKLTVVCFANGKAKTLLISAKEKRKVLIAMREADIEVAANDVLSVFVPKKQKPRV